MDENTKSRLLYGAAGLIGLGLTFYNWNLRQTEGEYYPRSSFFGPVAAVIMLFLALFPEYGTRGPDKPAREGVVLGVVVIAGFIAGGVNLYLISR